MKTARCTFRVAGLDCSTEEARLRQALRQRLGVRDLAFNLVDGTMVVEYDAAAVDPPRLIGWIADSTGMKASLIAARPDRSESGRAWLARWGWTLASGSALVAGVVFGVWNIDPRLSLAAYLVAVALGAVELIPKAIRELGGFRLDIHVLMLIAVLGALGLGDWQEAATVAFLFGLSEALEAQSLERARRAVRALLEVTPEMAELIEDAGTTRVVAAADLRPGDRVRIRAGERVPIDGRVLSGRSSLNQMAVTGESIPVFKEPGDEVFAGTVNGDGALEVEASRPFSEALVSRVVEGVRAAQTSRAPIERGIARFAAVYTPMVVVLAACVMILPPLFVSGAEFRDWFHQGLVILVIACPCALVIATPVAVVSALASATKHGILTKGGQYLEEIGRLRVLAFDKTGTLTRGEPDVVEVVSSAGRADGDLLRIAAALGDQGNHVLGRAIARRARELDLDVPAAHAYRAVPGLGATAVVNETEYHIGSHRYIDEAGLCPSDFHDSLDRAEQSAGTSVALSTSAGPLGWIRLADRPRTEAAQMLADLKELGIETVMLTGDNNPTAAALAKEIGMGEPRSGLLPADKAAVVAELESHRGPTGMVGDGVNDAEALAAARVSIAIGGSSSGVALEVADVVLLSADLSQLPWLVRHSRRMTNRIRQNIALALGSKILVFILALLGYASLWTAIAADLGVSLVVVANALRLLRNDRTDRAGRTAGRIAS